MLKIRAILYKWVTTVGMDGGFFSYLKKPRIRLADTTLLSIPVSQISDLNVRQQAYYKKLVSLGNSVFVRKVAERKKVCCVNDKSDKSSAR